MFSISDPAPESIRMTGKIIRFPGYCYLSAARIAPGVNQMVKNRPAGRKKAPVPLMETGAFGYCAGEL